MMADDIHIMIKDDNNIYEFRQSLLFRYMKYTFQYVEPDINKRWIYEGFQILSIIVMVPWNIPIFYFFIHFIQDSDGSIYLHYYSNTYFFALQLLGIFLFRKYPHHVQKEIDYTYEMIDNEEKRKTTAMLRQAERQINNIMVTAVVMVIVFPIISNTMNVAIYREHGWIIYNDKIDSIFRTLFFVSILISRTLAMPFFLSLMFIVKIQCIQIDIYIDIIVNKKITEEKNDIFDSYNRIHKRNKKLSASYNGYIIAFITIQIISGILITVSGMSLYAASKEPRMILILLLQVSEYVFLCLVLFIILAKLSTCQRQVLPKVLELPCAKNESLQTVKRIEKLQRLEGTGYTIFGFAFTNMKTILIPLLGPIATVLFKFIIR